MNIEELVEYCARKKAVTEHFPFDEDTLVCKVGGKMFLLTSLKMWEKGEPSINVKCDPERAVLLREEFEEVLPGFHMSKIHWNTVQVNKGINDKIIKKMIDDSYDLVLKSLTKKLQAEISELVS